jgi:hypothetical protein
VSELLKRHTAYELQEQWVAEQYWPSGSAADVYRAILTGNLVGQRIGFDEKAQENIQKVIKMLDGTYKPPKRECDLTEAEKEHRKWRAKQMLKNAFGV